MSLFNSDGTDKSGKVGLGELPRVRPADATDIMAHHVMLAATYFEAVTHGAVAEQAFRDAILEQVGVLGKEHPAYFAACEFYKWLDHAYEKMKENEE